MKDLILNSGGRGLRTLGPPLGSTTQGSHRGSRSRKLDPMASRVAPSSTSLATRHSWHDLDTTQTSRKGVFPGWSLPGLHVSFDASGNGNMTALRDCLVLFGFLCDLHGDVRHVRRVAVRLFQVRAISARAAPGLSGLDYHGAGH